MLFAIWTQIFFYMRFLMLLERLENPSTNVMEITSFSKFPDGIKGECQFQLDKIQRKIYLNIFLKIQ